MRNFIFRKSQVTISWLSGSKSRCSISSSERVLLIDGKKRRRSKIGAIFKKIWKGILIVIELVLALDSLLDFASVILNWLAW